MDDFLILLQAKLDEAKSKGNVNADLNKLQCQLDKLKVQVGIDPKVISNLTKQLESVLNQKIVIPNIGIDTKSGTKAGQEYGKQFGQQAITNIKEKISTLKKEQSNIASTQIFNTKDLDSQGKIYIQKVNNTIEKTRSELESKLRNAGYMDIQIKGVEDTTGKVKSLTATVTDATGAFKQLNFERAKIQGNGKAQAGFVQSDDVKIVGNISSAIDKVQNNLSSLKIKWEEQGVLIGDFKTNVEQLESSLSSVGSKGELNGLKLQIQNLKNEAATLSRINEIQFSIDNGHSASEYQNRIQSLINDFQKYGVAAETAKTQTASLQQIFDNMKGISGQELVNQADKFEQEFKAVKISIEEAKLSYDKLLQPVSDEKISSLIIKINSFLKSNTAITQDSRVQLENYVKELSGKNINLEKWNSINNEFIKIKANMSILDKLGKSLKDQFVQAAGTLTQYFSIAKGFSFLLNQLQQIPRKVIAVNSAMIELNKVSDASAYDIKKYFDEAAKSAKELGSSVSDVITATADFSRLGYSLPDSAKLSKVATLYKNVGDGIDINEASSSIVSTMKAFKIEAKDAISIVDKINYPGASTQAL